MGRGCRKAAALHHARGGPCCHHLWRPPSERQCEDPSQTDQLRKQFADVFPHGSAPSRILHVSLMRILDVPEAQLEAKADAVRIVCEKATEKLQGYRFNITRLLFVHEMQVLTLREAGTGFPSGRTAKRRTIMK